MAVIKNKESQVKNFSFGQLVPEAQVVVDSKHYEFADLSLASNKKNNITEDKIRLERGFESKSSFEIEPLVKEHRGLVKQAESDFEERVQAEVARRLKTVEKEAIEKGHAEGVKAGSEQAYNEAKVMFEEKISDFEVLVENLQKDMTVLLEQNKDEAYLMIKNLTKWIILKEVDEKYYLTRLLAKLIHEINTKSNLIVRVNEKAFGYMPEVVKIVERKLGKLTNIRVEVDLDQEENGILLESENTMIDGSLETQFKAIDRVFENVGLYE